MGERKKSVAGGKGLFPGGVLSGEQEFVVEEEVEVFEIDYVEISDR